MKKALVAVALMVLPLAANAQQAPDASHELAAAAYQQGLALGAAIQKQKDAQEIADLKAQIEASAKKE